MTKVSVGSGPRWGGDCEAMRLLGLEGEYLSFIQGTETELGLLRHVLECDGCLRAVKDGVRGVGSGDLGDFGRLFDDVVGVEVADLEGLIVRRICQRIEQLERLRGDAVLELGDLRANLEPLISRDRGRTAARV